MIHAGPHTFQLDAALERLISSYPRLTPEEERDLSQSGSAGSRDKLVESNLRLVKSIVFKFSGCGFEAADLFSAGVTGLVKAVAHYNSSQGKLATFARHHIRGEILEHINTYRTSFHIPDSLCRRVNQYRAARQKLGDAAPNRDIAKALGWGVESVQYVRECSEHQQMVSLDALQADPDSDISRREILAVEYRYFEQFEILHDLTVYLAQVPDREAELLRLRWGIGVPNPLSVRAVAELLGMSRSSVSRMEHDTLQKLRKLAEHEFRTGSFH
jgi:RNA polymerase sigma factor (sigma-70 family)